MTRRTRTLTLALVLALVLDARPACAYSVLAHEANVDALWDRTIAPLLRARFPRATRQDLVAARAFAYGGSVIQDIGYYPFGSHFFSNLMHYVRSGDFVETLIADARTPAEYAFALGALAHYTADNTGHPEAVNRAVAIAYPKLRKKYGDRVTYAEAPANHVIVEFSFDVVQAAAGAYLSEAYHSFVGFQVATDLLERAFRDTYGLDVKDVLGDQDFAFATYRYSVSQLIPEITRAAWKSKADEIRKIAPTIDENAFVYSYTKAQYDREYGTAYRTPGFFAKILAFLYRLLPKIGPLRPLSFKTPTPQAEALFEQSFRDTRARYARALEAVGEHRLDLPNTDFDTGKPSHVGEYSLADKTYRELTKRLKKKRSTDGIPKALRDDIARFYATSSSGAATDR
ncbi:MAG TPA: zinc dependent phospholipase C family protein [Vicinamibacterales bacterium]|nr:zinc dependent phospholipase C family protein [Vicinamibacterales bacterium]